MSATNEKSNRKTNDASPASGESVAATDASARRELALSQWASLTELGTRRLRAAASSFDAIDRLWHRAGKPLLAGSAQNQLDAWLCKGHQVLFRWESGFPTNLRAIDDAPVAVYVRGNLSALARPRVAMVGSRAATHSGVALARKLAAELSQAGVLVVSGLAQGIDAAAHTGALACRQPTLAIPGSGLGNLYPRGHRGLAEQIIGAGGLLLSEYAPWVAARPNTFPARNRLISGLVAGVVVVQAAQRSGSLITARTAGEQGREVMAVPGVPGSPVGAGCNQLLREGAALIETADDVFNALSWDLPAREPDETATDEQNAQFSDEHRKVLSVLDAVPVPIDQLAQIAGLPVEHLQAILLVLELRGLVRATAQGYIRGS